MKDNIVIGVSVQEAVVEAILHYGLGVYRNKGKAFNGYVYLAHVDMWFSVDASLGANGMGMCYGMLKKQPKSKLVKEWYQIGATVVGERQKGNKYESE